MNSRSDRIYREQTSPIEGLEIDPDHGYISVIIPETTINLCANPSLEYGVTTGWGAVNGSTIALTYSWQAYGAAGLSITKPGGMTPPASGCSYGLIALTAGTTYTASVTIQDDPGKIHYIQFVDFSGNVLSTRRWIANGLKQRIWVTYTAASSINHYIYIMRDIVHSDARPFYVDGLQVEAKSYPTTYADGDQVGFIVGETAFWWNGTPGASASTRSATTRAGGREMNLLDNGFKLLTIMGLGLSGLVDQFLPIPGLGGLPQGTGTTVRDFQLVGSIYGDGPRHLMSIRDDLIDAFKPDAALKPQPLVLRYQHCDEDGAPDSDSLDIQCKFLQGLEGNTGNAHQENLALAFRQYVPFVSGTYSQGVELGFQTTIANANYILKRGSDGIWAAMATGAGDVVGALAKGQDGYIYVGGLFLNLGGAGGDGIAYWNGTAFVAWAAGLAGSHGISPTQARKIIVGPDGAIYIAGNFTSVNGVAAVCIAKWDGANWTALGAGADDGEVYSMAIDHNGWLYAVGDFTQMGGIANTGRIARWDGAAWHSVGGGLAAGTIYDVAIRSDNSIYIGGSFATIGGITYNNIAMWDGVHWNKLGAGTNGAVDALKVIADGTLYIGGLFTTVTTGIMPIRANNVARWNGIAWSTLGAGLNGNVWTISDGPNGLIYFGGYFSTADGKSLPDSIAAWNGSTWMPVDVNLPGAALVGAILYDKQTDSMYIGFSTAGSAISATVTVPTVGSSTAYPIFYLRGPGTIWQIKNYITGKSIFFNLTLLAGETATLNLDPFHPSFVSSFRGDIWGSAILQGSDLDFSLANGVNNISAYIFGSTSAATHATLHYQPLYWSIDGAILK